jgi:SPP1 gp7 family putative phage head morphogenesis protein
VPYHPSVPGTTLLDIGPEDFGSLDVLQRALARIASNAVRRLLGLEATLHTKTWRRDVDRVLGVDLAAVVRDEDLEAYLDAAATRNTNLIESLSQRQVARVKQIMLDAITRGQSVQDTRKLMVDSFGIADSHAQLIARDQTAKLTSDLNRIRHTQAGIERYTWRTSLDERVRPRHRALEGNVYEYGEATGAESGLPPGQPIQCRCIAQAIVDP